MSLSPRRSAKVAPDDGIAETTAVDVPADNDEDATAADGSTSSPTKTHPVEGPRYGPGQILRCVLPVLNDDLTQLCRVEGFNQRKLEHDVRRLHDDGRPYDTKRTQGVDLSTTAHSADTFHPLRQHQSWTT